MLHRPIDTSLSRRALIRNAGLLGAGAIGSCMPFGNLAFAQASAAAMWPQTSAWIAEYVDEGHVANIVSALGWQQNAPDYLARGTHAFGGSTRAGPDSIYRIYSMTKPITGMAVMLLIEDGLLTLDQPLADIIPAFADMQVQREYDGAITQDNLEPAERQITIRHLLTHTAGFGYNIVQSGPIRDAYMAAGLAPGAISKLPMARAFFDVEMAPSLAEFAERLATLPLVNQPGQRWRYSVSHDVLGYVVQLVSGQRFEDFLQERILGPCGMTDTRFRVPQTDVSRLTTNYFNMGGIPVPIDPPDFSVYTDEPAFAFGGAGLVSTARDYDRFLQMLAGFGEIEGIRVMGEETVRIATSNIFPETLVSGGAFYVDGTQFGYGAGGLVGAGAAAGLFGWTGAAGTAGFVDMNTGLRMSLMTQYMPSSSLPMQFQFPQIVGRDARAAMAV